MLFLYCLLIGTTEEPVLPGAISSSSFCEIPLLVFNCICFSHITFFSHYIETDLFLSWHSLDEDFGFSPWSSWSPCGKTCTNAVSPAIKSRQRKCITPPCSGSSHQEKACNLPQCSGVNVEISRSASCYMDLFGSVQLVFASTAFCGLHTTKK